MWENCRPCAFELLESVFQIFLPTKDRRNKSYIPPISGGFPEKILFENDAYEEINWRVSILTFDIVSKFNLLLLCVLFLCLIKYWFHVSLVTAICHARNIIYTSKSFTYYIFYITQFLCAFYYFCWKHQLCYLRLVRGVVIFMKQVLQFPYS